MKLGKILFGIFILLSFSKQAFILHSQTKDVFFPIFIVILAIIICGLFIRSAFKADDKLKMGNKYNKAVWNFVKIISIIGLLGVILPTNMYQQPKNEIKVNSQEWTKEMENSLKNVLLKRLQGTYFEQTNDINKYCDCLVDSLKKYPIDIVMSGKIRETEDFIRIEYNCQNLSLK
jgi:hypothetical protein